MNDESKSRENQEFSRRLRLALKRSGHSSNITTFASDYNARAGALIVTVSAARKWLLGRSMPTQPRLQVLADWLDISVDWLRFGSSATPALAHQTAANVAASLLLQDLSRLEPSGKMLVRELVTVLLTVNLS